MSSPPVIDAMAQVHATHPMRRTDCTGEGDLSGDGAAARCNGTGEHDTSHKAGCAREGDLSGDGVIDGMQDGAWDGARDCTADETGDGPSECMRDETADAEDNDTNIERDVDRWQEDGVKAYWVRKVWPFIARRCLGCRCDREDFAQMLGPNKGVFLLPRNHSKCFMVSGLQSGTDDYLQFPVLASVSLEGASPYH